MKSFYAVIFLLLISCKTTKDTSIDQVVTVAEKSGTEIVRGQALLKRTVIDDVDTVEIENSINYAYYSGSGLLKDTVNQHIIDFVRGNIEFEYEERPIQLNDAFFKSELAYFDSLSNEEALLLESVNRWDINISTDIKEFKDFVELDLSVWSYTGGAHGNGYVGFELIDRKTAVVLKLTDVIKDIPEFTLLAEKYFRIQNDIEPSASFEELGFWFQDNKFACNENFFFEGNSLHFFYNSYEIAPYAAGQLEFSIPLADIKYFLKIQP